MQIEEQLETVLVGALSGTRVFWIEGRRLGAIHDDDVIVVDEGTVEPTEAVSPSDSVPEVARVNQFRKTEYVDVMVRRPR